MEEIYKIGQHAPAIVFDDIVAEAGTQTPRVCIASHSDAVGLRSHDKIRPMVSPGDHILINGREYIVTFTLANPSPGFDSVEITVHAKASPCSSTDRASVYEAEDAGSIPAGDAPMGAAHDPYLINWPNMRVDGMVGKFVREVESAALVELDVPPYGVWAVPKSCCAPVTPGQKKNLIDEMWTGEDAWFADPRPLDDIEWFASIS